jgi:hypothetical protein
LWLSHGRVQLFPTHEVVVEKQKTHGSSLIYEKQTAHAHETSQPELIARLEDWCVESKLSTNAHTISSGYAPLVFRFQIELRMPVPNGKTRYRWPTRRVSFFTPLPKNSGNKALVRSGLGWSFLFFPLKPGEYILSCTISDGIHPVALLWSSDKACAVFSRLTP